MQFGFMKSKGTTDAIFMARQMQENFRVKGKKLYFGFVDLEKAFDRDLGWKCINYSCTSPVTRCQILRLKCTKFDFCWGSAPDPAGGANSAPPDPLAGFKGAYF